MKGAFDSISVRVNSALLTKEYVLAGCSSGSADSVMRVKATLDRCATSSRNFLFSSCNSPILSRVQCRRREFSHGHGSAWLGIGPADCPDRPAWRRWSDCGPRRIRGDPRRIYAVRPGAFSVYLASRQGRKLAAELAPRFPSRRFAGAGVCLHMREPAVGHQNAAGP